MLKKGILSEDFREAWLGLIHSVFLRHIRPFAPEFFKSPSMESKQLLSSFLICHFFPPSSNFIEKGTRVKSGSYKISDPMFLFY